MKRYSFSLIELLVVISIIVILVGIAIPVYLSVTAKARRSKAKFQIQELMTALSSYKASYQAFPFYPANSSYDDVLINTDSLNGTSGDPYNDLITTLRGTRADLNPRKQIFLSQSTGSFVDPWGEVFFVALDYRGDGEINESSPGNTTPKIYGASVVASDIAIWSKGPDKKHSSTDSDASNQDNITSWSN
ncbi:MAG: prepilin-type N-terminal cleavage/methylation domain-containing protein [Lentisphaerae bacterium]|nr:MAG: prepilin-type N-terminal cleavage/methylation domain-containing protein [Lentisphaerota bacterium]